MSTPSPIDYDALAQQHGGTAAAAVDYDALAAQHGGVAHSDGTRAAHDIKAAPSPLSKEWWKQKYYEGVDALSNSLPAAGGTIGGVLGATGGTFVEPGGGSALGAVGGAGIGGMVGQAGKNFLRSAAFPHEQQMDAAQTVNGITHEGITQAAMQAFGEIAPFAAGPLKQAAEKQYARALAPTTKINKAITQKIVPEMMDRGVYGSLPSIEGQASSNIEALQTPLNKAIDAIPRQNVQGAATDVMDSLQELKKQYIVNSKIANPPAVNAINGVQDIVQQFGDNVSPQSLRKLRQIFDDPVAKKAGYAGADLSTQYTLQAQKQAADTLRGILNSASPDVAEINKEMSFWLNVQQVTRESGLRQTGQQGGLLKTFLPMGAALGAAGGFVHGGAAQSVEGAGISTGLAALGVAMRTPAWRTTSAALKNSVADALASGNMGRVSVLLGRFGVAAAGSSPATQQADRREGQ